MVQPQVAMPLPIPVTLQPQPPQEDGLVYWSIAPEDRRHDSKSTSKNRKYSVSALSSGLIDRFHQVNRRTWLIAVAVILPVAGTALIIGLAVSAASARATSSLQNAATTSADPNQGARKDGIGLADGCQAIASERQACEVEAATAEDCALQGCCWDAKAAAADAEETGSVGEAAPPVDNLLADSIKLCYQKIAPTPPPTPPSTTTTVDTNIEPKQPDGVDGPAGGAPNNRGEADGSATNNNDNGIEDAVL